MVRTCRGVSSRLITWLLATGILPAMGAIAEGPRLDPAEFVHHLESVVPALLQETRVPGAAVALVHDGRITYLSGFGWADSSSRVRVDPDTLFNVASISKTITAWGVLALVERGALRLDASVVELLGGWPLSDGSSPEGVTVERLLNHSGGLSAPSVPEYLPWERVQSSEAWLSSSDSVRLENTPGEKWSYSGAGYSLLQLIIERLTDEGFEENMKRGVLEPLDMVSSTFHHPSQGLAQPYEGGVAIPFRRYSGRAAAGLYTSAEDMAKFLVAHSAGGGKSAGRGVVSASTLTRMRAPTPLSRSRFNTAYGLGYSVWPLAKGELSSGHRGQNHGWAAVAWLSPDGRNGLAVLTNDSDGEDLYRWIFCDWAHWLAGRPSFGGYCAARLEHAAGPLFADTDESGQDLFELIRQRVPSDGPGIAALVARDGKVLLRDAVGLADVEAGVELTAATPFYIASVAKPMTAAVVLELIARGELALDDRVAMRLPDFPDFGHSPTVRQLLEHSSGTPDYWNMFDWSRPTLLSNEAVFELVRGTGQARFPAGTRFEYSNTGYIGLASLAESVTGTPFADLLLDLLPGTPSSSALSVLDEAETDIPQRARGYAVHNGGLRLVDYRRIELPESQPVEPAFSTVGAGGSSRMSTGSFASPKHFWPASCCRRRSPISPWHLRFRLPGSRGSVVRRVPGWGSSSVISRAIALSGRTEICSATAACSRSNRSRKSSSFCSRTPVEST